MTATPTRKVIDIFHEAHASGLEPEDVTEMLALATDLSHSDREIDQRTALALLRHLDDISRPEIETPEIHHALPGTTLGFHIGIERKDPTDPFARSAVGLPTSLAQLHGLDDLELVSRTFADWRRRATEDTNALAFHRGLLTAAYLRTTWETSPETGPDGSSRGAGGRSYIAKALVYVVRQTPGEVVQITPYWLTTARSTATDLITPTLKPVGAAGIDGEEDALIRYLAGAKRSRPSTHQAIDLLDVSE